MQDGLVIDEFGTAVTPGRAYRGHMRLYYYRALDDEPRIPFEETVLYQDEHLVIADKPHFCLSRLRAPTCKRHCWCGLKTAWALTA